MMKLKSAFVYSVFFFYLSCNILYWWGYKATKEKNRYRANMEALLGDIKRMRLDSLRSAVEVNGWQLSVSELKRYRQEDAELIKELGIELKTLKAIARHNLEVNVPVTTVVKDSVIVRDTVSIEAKIIDMETPHLTIKGVIENNYLSGSIYLPVNIHQAVWIDYKRKFLWWRWKPRGIHQTIISDNPYVEVKHSEYIEIKK